MKRKLLLLLLPLLCTGCDNIFEKQIMVYNDSKELVAAAGDAETLVDNVIDAEIAVAVLRASHSEEADNELLESLGGGYYTLRDSLYAVRADFFRSADDVFGKFTGHFVEKRIMLYEKAAERYEKVGTREELEAVEAVVKRFSAMAYVDGQRVCDPPASLRKAYTTAKAKAKEKYDNALLRLE